MSNILQSLMIKQRRFTSAEVKIYGFSISMEPRLPIIILIGYEHAVYVSILSVLSISEAITKAA
jgi:hypothetical protein